MTTDTNITVTTPDDEWKGLTLEQLRARRAKALLRREVGKYKINAAIDGMRTRVNDNGIRGLMFNDKTIGRLKVADYALLGWKIMQLFIKARRKK